jgi:hypothetical protein
MENPMLPYTIQEQGLGALSLTTYVLSDSTKKALGVLVVSLMVYLYFPKLIQKKKGELDVK